MFTLEDVPAARIAIGVPVEGEPMGGDNSLSSQPLSAPPPTPTVGHLLQSPVSRTNVLRVFQDIAGSEWWAGAGVIVSVEIRAK